LLPYHKNADEAGIHQAIVRPIIKKELSKGHSSSSRPVLFYRDSSTEPVIQSKRLPFRKKAQQQTFATRSNPRHVT
jgi:hypothetical protein